MNRFVITNVLCAAASLLGAGNVVLAEEAEQEGLHIEAQPLSSALREFSEQTGLQIGYAAELAEGKETAGVAGTDDPEVALDALLASSGLEHRFVNAETVVIRATATSLTEAEGSSDLGNARTTPSQVNSPAPALQPAAAAQESASAETNQNVLDEIVVTARRRTEFLQDVPISVTAFSEADIERNNIKDITDYFWKTPNVSYVQEGVRSDRSISIRGVSNIGGTVDALAIYVDEVNISNGPRGSSSLNSSINPMLQDVERIEVLRGPQGTYFGRNATGGAINITMNKPGPERFAELNAEYGKHNTWGLGSILNVPVTDDSFFLRGSVYFEESDGQIENVNPIGGGSSHQYTDLRAAARFLPSDSLTIDLTAQYTEEDTGAAATVATGVLTEGAAGLLIATLGQTEPLNETGGFYPENQTRINNNFRPFHRNEFLLLTTQLEWDAGPATITSVTGLFDGELQFKKDVDFTSLSFIRFDTDVSSRSVSTELRVASNADGPIQWILGGIYAKDTLDRTFCTCTGTDGLLGLPPDFTINSGETAIDLESYGIFGEVSWDAIDRLTLTLGGRYSYDEVFQFQDGTTFGVPDTPTDATISFNDFSPKVALNYEWTDRVTTYATVSKGYKAGGVQFNVAQNLPIVPFDEENLWNYEIGLKSVWLNGRVASNWAVFYMDWQDLQAATEETFVDTDTGNISFIAVTTNASRATVSGVEADIRALLTDKLEVGAAIGYLKAEFDEFPDAIVGGETVDLSGEDIPRAPDLTASADAHYTLDRIGGWEPYLRAEWTYRSDTVDTLDNIFETGFPYHPPSFSVTNFRIGAERERYRIEAYLNNVFDEDFYTIAGHFGFSGTQLVPAEQYWGIRFRMRTNY